jgi:hypothetical protein
MNIYQLAFFSLNLDAKAFPELVEIKKRWPTTSVVDPDPNPDSDPGGQKWPTKIEKSE